MTPLLYGLNIFAGKQNDPFEGSLFKVDEIIQLYIDITKTNINQQVIPFQPRPKLKNHCKNKNSDNDDEVEDDPFGNQSFDCVYVCMWLRLIVLLVCLCFL